MPAVRVPDTWAVAMRKRKKPLSAAPGCGSPRGTQGHEITAFNSLSATTTGQTLAYFPNHVNNRVIPIRTMPKIVITKSQSSPWLSCSRHSGLRGKASSSVRGYWRVVLFTLGSCIRIMLSSPGLSLAILSPAVHYGTALFPL